MATALGNTGEAGTDNPVSESGDGGDSATRAFALADWERALLGGSANTSWGEPHDGLIRDVQPLVPDQSKYPVDYPWTGWTVEAEPEPDMVNEPPHYTSHPSGVECIEITQHMNYCIGNAVKYLWRVDGKGDPVQNLRKAIFYIEQEIERREAA